MRETHQPGASSRLRQGFRLRGWTVRPELNLIERNGTQRRLEAKVMDVLVELAAAEGHPVAKEELLARVWAKTVVVDSVVYRAVTELRSALGEDGNPAQIVEHVPKRGYRLLAPIEPVTEPAIAVSTPVAEPERPRRSGWTVGALVASGVALALAVSYSVNQWHSRTQQAAGTQARASAPADLVRPAQRRIAVLPFVDMSDSRSYVWLAEGLSEEITHTLTQVPGLAVVARTSAFVVAEQKLTAPQIGARLGVDTLLEGSVRLDDDGMRVTAQLINTHTGTHLWSQTYETPRSELFAVQADIAQRIVHSLRGMLDSGGTPTFAPPEVPYRVFDAYLVYLQAQALWRQRNASALQTSAELLARAAELDPTFARAHSLRANVLFVLTRYSTLADETAQPLIRAAAQRALELDANDADAWLALGSIATGTGERDEALDAFARAVELEPGNPLAHHRMAERLLSLGYLTRAGTHVRRAVELDPLSSTNQTLLAFWHAVNGQPGQALRSAALARELGSARAAEIESYAHLQLGRVREAYVARREAMNAMRRRVDHLEAVYRSLAHGDRASARAALQALPRTDGPESDFLFYEYGLLGLTEESLAALRRMRGQGGFGPLWLPELSGLRSDPRFIDVLEEWGFIAHWQARGAPDLCFARAGRYVCR